jgi:peptide/nickel transport system permease protein
MSTRVERSAAPLTETPLRAAMLRRIRSRPTAIGAAFALGAMIGLALLAPLLAPQNPYDLTSLSIMDNRLPPGSTAMSGMTYWLGTDAQGRDMLSAILYGIRISLVVGLLATACAAAIGMGVGLFAGYLGGLIETALMRLVDFFLGFPTLLVALVLLAMIGRGVDKVVLAIVLVQWAHYARLMRGSVLVERRKEYVEAAKNLGFSRARIMLLHILPNCMGPILVFATIHVATAIALEATLSFLGVGVPVTEPSLGLLIANGFEHLLSGEYWISFYPGVALLVLIFSINLLGDRLRESLDPRRRA